MVSQMSVSEKSCGQDSVSGGILSFVWYCLAQEHPQTLISAVLRLDAEGMTLRMAELCSIQGCLCQGVGVTVHNGSNCLASLSCQRMLHGIE